MICSVILLNENSLYFGVKIFDDGGGAIVCEKLTCDFENDREKILKLLLKIYKKILLDYSEINFEAQKIIAPEFFIICNNSEFIKNEIKKFPFVEILKIFSFDFDLKFKIFANNFRISSSKNSSMRVKKFIANMLEEFSARFMIDSFREKIKNVEIAEYD